MTDKKAPKGKKDDENSWRTQIETAPLDDENWKVKVVILESAGSEQDRMYLNKFEIFAAQERRFVIKNICKTETIFMVNQLGSEKKVKDANLRVFEEGQAFLKERLDIPPEYLALIIKHLILKLKDEYLFIKRQKLEVQLGIRDEMELMFDKPEVRNLAAAKAAKEVPEPEPLPPTNKKEKVKNDSNQTEIPAPDVDKKYSTFLRERGEEWRDKVYVDDFPIDGPNLYVAITGFAEPNLAGCLLNIGIPLTAVVQIRIDPCSVEIPVTLMRTTKRGQSQTEILAEKALQFWDEVQQIRIHKNSSERLKNTAFLIFKPPYWDFQKLSGDDDKIYDEVCYLLYDIQDLFRQHNNYLENMAVVDIPIETENKLFTSHYKKHIGYIPDECVTIYSIIDSILQTVCYDWDKEATSSLSNSRQDNDTILPEKDEVEEKVENATSLIQEVYNTLCKSETNKKLYRITYGDEYEIYKEPIIISYGNDAQIQTFHLGNFNLQNIVWSSLYCMPTNLLWRYTNRPVDEIEAKINFHVNVLLSCFKRKDIETAELNRLIHILAFRKLYNNRSSTKKVHLQASSIKEFKKHFLKRSILAEPFPDCSSILRLKSAASFSAINNSENNSKNSSINNNEECKINFLFDCPDLMELVSAAEIANNKPLCHLIDDFEYFEDLNGINGLQTVLKASSNFNCVDYKYCEVTDCLLMMFHNSHDKDSISNTEWRSHLSTPVCLQDFFDFVLEENYEWIKNQENLYDLAMGVNLNIVSKNIIDLSSNHCCIQNTDVGRELLMEGSLKHQETIQLDDEATDNLDNLSLNASTIVGTMDTKFTPKTRNTEASPKKLKKFTSITTTTVCDESEILIVKPFLGYNLSDRRVEAFGKDSAYFSTDGTKVKSIYSLIIPNNLEYLSLSVAPGNGKSEFWFHKAFGKFVPQKTLDMCDSFRITVEDNLIINVSKRTYEERIPTSFILPPDGHNKKDITNSASNLSPNMFETKFYYDFVKTWPNGLVTESVYESNSPNISHIKQFYTSKLPDIDEQMRCISLKGEVIIFKSDGNDIEVLRPDGSIILIRKCQKKIAQGEHHRKEDSPDESDKNSSKKKSSKDKLKDQKSTKSAKVSKHTLPDSDKSEAKAVSYEMSIEEFEIIKANGTRELWVNDKCYFLEKILIRTATDYCLGEIYSRRMDGTNTLLNKDGIFMVTFPDKTKIISKYVIEDFEIYPEWTEEEIEYFELYSNKSSETEKNLSQSSSTASKMVNEEESIKSDKNDDGFVSVQLIYKIEHFNFTTVTIDKVVNKISVDSPNDTTVTVDLNNCYEFNIDPVTKATFDGLELNMTYEACSECKAETICGIQVDTIGNNSETRLHHQWLQMKDSFCKKIFVNGEGIIRVADELSSETLVEADAVTKEESVTTVNKEAEISEASLDPRGKCSEMYRAKQLRFIVLRRDLSCSELIHKVLIEDYKQICRWQPWCSITQHDSFGDHRLVHSVLTPLHLNESEKWLMNSSMADKPLYLTYKDLKQEGGKGFYHWMRPYKRFYPDAIKSPSVIPPRTPRAFVQRTLEQQWREKDRENLKGAKELVEALLLYRRIMENDSETLLNIPIIDPRTDSEKSADERVQGLGQRIYEDLKIRLEADMLSRVKADITTQPPPPTEEMSVGEENIASSYAKSVSDRASSIVQADVAEELSPNLKKYWRRRAEELKEEEFYKYLLRNPSIPPYFHNVLGGAIWWEVNNAADRAATKAERRKMRCHCDEDATTTTTNVETHD